MSEMVERVARAIAGTEIEMMCARDGDRGAETWALRKYGSPAAYVDARWPAHVPGARAAIAALREPTDRVTRAMMKALAEEHTTNVNLSATLSAYAAGIDAALGETL